MTDDGPIASLHEGAGPFRELLGITITYRGKDRAEGEMPVTANVCRSGNILHGGAFMGFADTVAGHGTGPHLPDGGNSVTIESKTNFFAAIPLGDIAKAVAIPLHVGRTTIVMQTSITRGDGKLAALIIQTQLVLQKKA